MKVECPAVSTSRQSATRRAGLSARCRRPSRLCRSLRRQAALAADARTELLGSIMLRASNHMPLTGVPRGGLVTTRQRDSPNDRQRSERSRATMALSSPPKSGIPGPPGVAHVGWWRTEKRGCTETAGGGSGVAATFVCVGLGRTAQRASPSVIGWWRRARRDCGQRAACAVVSADQICRVTGTTASAAASAVAWRAAQVAGVATARRAKVNRNGDGPNRCGQQAGSRHRSPPTEER